MNPIIMYLLKANGLLLFFWLFYRLFLRKETFYTSIRWYFISAIILSLSIPFFTYTKTIIIEQEYVNYQTDLLENIPFNPNIQQIEPSFWEKIDWQNILIYVIALISFFFIIRSIFHITKLFLNIKHLKSLNKTNIKITTNQKNVYSFYRWIVVPENKISSADFEMILAHENIHLNQKHTFDLILIELVSCVFWFNPLIKKLQKDINTNLEFIVDEKMISNFEPVLYQKSLLNEQNNFSLTYINAFNTNDLKKRIIQLNTQKSRNMKKLKFLVAAPVLASFFMLFQIETVAQIQTIEVEKELPNDEKEDSFYVLINNKYDDAYYQNLTKTLKEKYDLDVVIDKLKRNKKGELTDIRIAYKNDLPVIIGRYSFDIGKPFDAFKLRVYKNNDNKYFIEKVSDDENNNSSIHYQVEVDAVVEKENDPNKLSFDAETLRTNRKVFDEVVKRYPIVVDNIPLTKKQLKQFDNSTIQSMNWDIDQTGKKVLMTLNLSTKNEPLRIISNNTESSTWKVTMPYKEEVIGLNNSNQQENQVIKSKAIKAKIDFKNNVLYILDEKEVSSEEINKTHPNSIESITVLKDKKAIEKYGAKAKNGVLLITTKKDKETSLQQKKEALKARELSVKERKELTEKQKEQIVQHKKEIEKHRQQLTTQKEKIVKEAEQSRKEIEKQRQELLAKRDEIRKETEQRKKEIEKVRQEKERILKNEIAEKSEKNSKEWDGLKEIFDSMKQSKKDLEDENAKITHISAKMTLKDGSVIEMSENY